MVRLLPGLILLLAAEASAAWNGTCDKKSQRKAWHRMSVDERKEYIDAELCLMERPPIAGIEGAQNLWDELQFAHITQSNIIHNVGAFFPWHRYYMRVHEYLLQTECGYKGGQPYWEQVRDVDNFAGSVVFDPVTGFGGEGSECVLDGPFTNLRMHINGTSTSANYCLSRAFNATAFTTAKQQNIDECFNLEKYEDSYSCYQALPHTAGHFGVGGTMYDPAASPGEPLFYLHHTNLDRLWWEWQQANLTFRLTDMGGQNMPSEEFLRENGFPDPTSAVIDYFGDGGGNVTTLNHNLWMVGVAPNVTVRDVMDIGGSLNCAEYV
ncbi:unnamed protein product [Clonostachys rosea f. rosea IK726]|uniref:Uncharacterized protein n=1 Tax=Clonostachys rosea f. rosea IK726 TaxID=1349383 RepID=A0ACA9UJ52_BIOOC|nr:unnamed protein product [Clonostachys rosea f. rosea IK726]